MAVTISDVATAAGVSASTVSRALTRPERVDAETKARIFAQIERLGYKVNRAARGLVTGRTSNLAVIVADLANPFFPDIVKGIQLRAQRHNLTTLLADAGENPDAELNLVGSLAPQVDGIVLCGSRMSEEQLAKARQLAPVLLVNRATPGHPAVTVDNADGMRQAVRHLRALRHRRIGYVGGPPRQGSTSSSSSPRRPSGGAGGDRGPGRTVPDVRFVPTGGVGPRNLADYVALRSVCCVGGSWMVPRDAMRAGDWRRVTELCRHAVVPEEPAAHEDPRAFVRRIVTACASAICELTGPAVRSASGESPRA